MGKYLNTFLAGVFFLNVTGFPLNTSAISSEKQIKAVGDFNGDGIKEPAKYDGRKTIKVDSLPNIEEVIGCDSLSVKNGKKDILIIHYKDKMEKAEYHPDGKFWSTMPYEK